MEVGRESVPSFLLLCLCPWTADIIVGTQQPYWAMVVKIKFMHSVTR